MRMSKLFVIEIIPGITGLNKTVDNAKCIPVEK
jgi:hypothetical protein